ncbi:MAG: M20/M25/M40 family metallo-hydrolase [Elusimicrobia bacterium]|nr:M20/M25/M40 family metallo-hydrolase [Elusimicrobiota bacterium]
MSEPASFLERLVGVPSESGREDAAADLVEAELRALGLAPKRVGRSVHATLGSGGGLLLLNSHLDTVPAGEGWTRNPLGERTGGRLYGRGANDAKGCVAAMLAGAVRAYARTAPGGRVCLAFGCEEETSNRGITELMAELPAPDAAVVGEPTGLAPAVAQKGLLLLEVTAKGRSAHAAWGGGVNAVHAAAKDILALAAVSFDREHPVLGKPSLQVTQVQGGERHNVIPDRCRLVVDIRTTPDYAPEEIVALVERAVGGEVSIRSRRLQSVDTPVGHPIVRAAVAAGGGEPFGSPTASDWAFLKGIPAVKAGPGDSRRSHTPDEYLELSELEGGVAFYERLIRAYHEGTP